MSSRLKESFSQLIGEYIDYREELRDFKKSSKDYNRYGYQCGIGEIEEKYNYIENRLDDFFYEIDSRLCELESK